MKNENKELPSLTDRVSEHTDVTYGDLVLIGGSLLSAIGIVAQLGHASPGSSLDYIHFNEENSSTDSHARIVRDFIAWTSRRKSLAPGCEERLRVFIRESGWQYHQQMLLCESLGLGSFQPASDE